jgi:hypothetical protein
LFDHRRAGGAYGRTALGGGTDLDNECLLCGYHHREHGNRGWQVIIPDGQPYWIPPPRIDPARTPIRNTAHDGPVTLALEPA